MTFNRVVFSSKSYKWDSPDKVVEELDQEFHFTFDPAVPPRFGNFKGNGLKSPWSGVVFVNPPYKRKLILRWVQKGWKELYLGHCQLIVFLIPFRNSDYFKYLRKKGAEFRLCEKRLKFKDAAHTSDTAGTHGAPFDSVIAILKK